MQKQDIETILASQRKFFATGKTLPVSWRLEQLKKFKNFYASPRRGSVRSIEKRSGKKPDGKLYV